MKTYCWTPSFRSNSQSVWPVQGHDMDRLWKFWKNIIKKWHFFLFNSKEIETISNIDSTHRGLQCNFCIRCCKIKRLLAQLLGQHYVPNGHIPLLWESNVFQWDRRDYCAISVNMMTAEFALAFALVFQIFSCANARLEFLHLCYDFNGGRNIYISNNIQ